MFIIFIVFFFFSSRRRHTRLQGDWSSDVCSSDLEFKQRRKAARDIDLPADDLQALVQEFKSIIQAKRGAPFPEDPTAQLWGAIEAVFKSWNTRRAADYRKVHGIPDDLGTALNGVAMVY